MAGENTSPDPPPTNHVEVKDSTPTEKIESEVVSHTGLGSVEQVIKDEGKLKENQAGSSDVAVPKIEEIIVDKKTEDEKVESLVGTDKPESDPQSGVQLEGTEVSSAKETGSEIAVTELKESAEPNDEGYKAPPESVEPGAGLGFEQVKSGETLVEDKTKEKEAAAQSSTDITSEKSRVETPDTGEVPTEDIKPESEKTVTEAPDTREVPTKDIIPDSKKSRIEAPDAGEVLTEDKGDNLQLEVTVTEVPADDKVQDSELKAPVVDASKAADSVENKPNAPPVDEPLLVTGAIERGQSASKEEDSVEKKPEVPDVEQSPPETEVPPSEREAPKEQSDVSLVSEHKTEAEDKLDERSTKLDVSQETVVDDTSKGGESSRDVPEQGLDFSKKDETVKVIVDSMAESEKVTDEPIKEQVAVQMQTDDKVLDSIAESEKVTNEPIKEQVAVQTEINDKVLDSIAESETVTDEPIKEQVANQTQTDDKGVHSIAESETVADEPIKEQVTVQVKIDNKVVESIAESETIADEPIKDQVAAQTETDDIVITTDREAQLTEAATEVASKVETEGESGIQNQFQNLDVEPTVKTTLQDLMKVEGVSKVTKELTGQPTAEAAVVSASTVIEQSQGTDTASIVETANDLKKSESDACESGEMVKEIVGCAVPTPMGPTTGPDEPKTEEMIQNTSAATPEKPIVSEELPLKVEESTELAENREKAEEQDKAVEELAEGEKKEETVEFSILNSDETAKDGAGETAKPEVTIKSVPRQSNNIMSKVKQSIVKVKKAITGKSPSSKSSLSMADVKVKQ